LLREVLAVKRGELVMVVVAVAAAEGRRVEGGREVGRRKKEGLRECVRKSWPESRLQ
jgi:hypothetical protein